MTLLQKLELRRSEIRSRLGELAALDELNDDQKAETDRITKEFQEKETQYRAAVIAEGEKAQTREFGSDGEAAEIRAIKRKSSLRNYLDAASKGTGLAGAEAELNDALEIRAGGGVRVPWTMLIPDVEFRADAPSDTSALDGGTAKRPGKDVACTDHGRGMGRGYGRRSPARLGAKAYRRGSARFP